MKDLGKVIKPYLDKDVLLISSNSIKDTSIEILKTVKLLQRWDLCSWPLLDMMVLNEFKLYINNNIIHRIMWENWMVFMINLNLIDIEVNPSYPSNLYITDADIHYLEYMSE